MTSKPFRLLIFIPALVLGAILTGCVYHSGPPVYSSAYYHPPYHYYYYPSTQVYFHLYSGHYYYRSDKRWLRVKILPSHIYLDSRDRVRLWVDVDKPYHKHERHVERYRPKVHRKPEKERDRKERSHNRGRHETYQRR